MVLNKLVTPEVLHIFYDNIAKMVSESAQRVKWLQTNHKLLWYRCRFNLEIKCDYITSNIAESLLIYLITCRKLRQSRKNVTKATPAEPSTPRRPTREEIIWGSPGRVTRR